MKIPLKDLAIGLIIVIIVVAVFPVVWRRVEVFEPGKDYRVPYQLSDDYWLFDRWSERASKEFPFLIFGDSFVWGEYVDRSHTLSATLNGLLGARSFANLGLDGLHPASMRGLVKHFSGSSANKHVLLSFDLLFLSSGKTDLTDGQSFPLNHPQLVPQFYDKPPSLRADFGHRINAIAKRYSAWNLLIDHQRCVGFENRTIPAWSLENPFQNPLLQLRRTIPDFDPGPKSEPVNWEARHVQAKDYQWVSLAASYQWHSFLKTVEILKARNNSLFIILCPINPYILSQASLQRHDAMFSEIEQEFRSRHVLFHRASILPTQEYADASHPLACGYQRIAEELLNDSDFIEWMTAR